MVEVGLTFVLFCFGILLLTVAYNLMVGLRG